MLGGGSGKKKGGKRKGGRCHKVVCVKIRNQSSDLQTANRGRKKAFPRKTCGLGASTKNPANLHMPGLKHEKDKNEVPSYKRRGVTRQYAEEKGKTEHQRS